MASKTRLTREAKADGYRPQFSDHGAGRYSLQIFRESGGELVLLDCDVKVVDGKPRWPTWADLKPWIVEVEARRLIASS